MPQAIADRHAAELGICEEVPATPSQPPSLPEEPSLPKPASASTLSSVPASQESLLRQTQAANRVIPAEGSPSPAFERAVADLEAQHLPLPVLSFGALPPGEAAGVLNEVDAQVRMLRAQRRPCTWVVHFRAGKEGVRGGC
jgi:hypothetical protein